MGFAISSTSYSIFSASLQGVCFSFSEEDELGYLVDEDAHAKGNEVEGEKL